MIIRNETEADQSAVYEINASAFATSAEAKLVDVLREQAQPHVSLVVDEEGVIVGHIMFSPVSLAGHPDVKIMGLAPMAVAPQRQRSGFGSALVRAGIDRCRELGCAAIIVLGHPEYYPRFGFVPASRFGIDGDYAVPDDVFMALELQPNALAGLSGRATYHAAFGAL